MSEQTKITKEKENKLTLKHEQNKMKRKINESVVSRSQHLLPI